MDYIIDPIEVLKADIESCGDILVSARIHSDGKLYAIWKNKNDNFQLCLTIFKIKDGEREQEKLIHFF